MDIWFVFAGNVRYPAGGFGDLISSHRTANEALQAVGKLEEAVSWDWIELAKYDTETLDIQMIGLWERYYDEKAQAYYELRRYGAVRGVSV